MDKTKRKMSMDIPVISAVYKMGVALVTFAARMDKQEKRQDEMEKNYLKQFREVRSDFAKGNAAILDKMHTMHIEVIDRINSKK